MYITTKFIKSITRTRFCWFLTIPLTAYRLHTNNSVTKLSMSLLALTHTIPQYRLCPLLSLFNSAHTKSLVLLYHTYFATRWVTPRLPAQQKTPHLRVHNPFRHLTHIGWCRPHQLSLSSQQQQTILNCASTCGSIYVIAPFTAEKFHWPCIRFYALLHHSQPSDILRINAEIINRDCRIAYITFVSYKRLNNAIGGSQRGSRIF